MYELAASGWLLAVIAGAGFIMTYVRNGKGQAKRDGIMEEKLKSMGDNLKTLGDNFTSRMDRFDERFGEYCQSVDRRFERIDNKMERRGE